MNKWLAIFVIAIWILPASAESNVSDQFSGIQYLQIPMGPLFKSWVFVHGNKVRIETTVDPGSREGAQVILVRPDEKAIYFLEPDRKQASRGDLTSPFPLLAPGYLTVALLFHKEIANQKLIWKKLENVDIDGQPLERFRVTGLLDMGMEAIVYILPSTKLPFRVELQPANSSQDSSLTTHANWSNMVQGQPDESLFTIPQDFKIVDFPKDLR